MPREIDAFPYYHKVTHDPNIINPGLNAGNASKYMPSASDIFTAIGEAQLYSTLSTIDSWTGLNLVQCAQQLGFNPPDGLAALIGYQASQPGSALKQFMQSVATDIRNKQQFTLAQMKQSITNGADDIRAMLSATDFQNLLDASCNALGQSGTGYTVDQFVGFANVNQFTLLVVTCLTSLIDNAIQVAAVAEMPPPDIHGLITLIDVFGGNWTGVLNQWAQDSYDNWQTLLTSLGLSSQTATELATWLSGVNNTAQNAQ